MNPPIGAVVDGDLFGFASDAYSSIAWAFYRAMVASAPALPQEPDLVASLFAFGVRSIGRRWAARCAPYGLNLRVSGVFCHQSPVVSHGEHQKDPELGDLLIVSVHTDATGSVTRRALLVQAKLCNGLIHRVGASDDHQLHLYEHWPPFRYVRPKALRRGRRTVRPNSPHEGAEFLLVSHLSQTDRMLPAWLARPARTLQARRHLSLGLVDMLAGRYGRPFKPQAEAQSGQGWSRVVWDLLDEAGSLLFTRRNMSMLKKRRGDADVPSFLAFTVPPHAPMAGRPILDGLDGLPQDGLVVRGGSDDTPSESQSGPRVVCIESVASRE